MYGLTNLETGITPPRLANLIAYSFFCHEFPGLFAEFGVMKGGSLDLLSSLHPDRMILGIDSFEGLPAPTQNDTHTKGEFALSQEEFISLCKYFLKKSKNVKIIKGFSPEVFMEASPDATFSFVHVDVDMYQSVKDALDFFVPRMFEGGMIIFDDYGFDTTPGAKKAIDEWRGKCRWRGELKFANKIFCGQYLIIK